MAYPSSVMSVIKEFDLACDKKYGQCFLIDNNSLDRIAEAAGIEKSDVIVEIGSGPGNLTARLAAAASLVLAFETDMNLFRIYEKYFAGANVVFRREDFLKAELTAALAAAEAQWGIGGRPVKVVANIPYYITSQIIEKILYGSGVRFSDVYLLMQRDVAERIAARPSTKEYGILSVACALKARPSIVRRVAASCFYPAPEVESALVRLEPFERETGEGFNEEIFFAVVKSAFNQRRKVAISAIANNIGRLGEINGYDGLFVEFLKKSALKHIFAGIFEAVGISPLARAEEISCEDYILIARELGGHFRLGGVK